MLVSTNLFLFIAALWIVFTDLYYRRISNQLLLVMVIAWVGFRSVDLVMLPNELRFLLLKELALTLLGSVGVFVVGFGLYLLKRMGAGDVKCIAVVCLWVGFEHQLIFLTMMSLFGGALALMLPLLNALEQRCVVPLMYLADRFPRWVERPTTLDSDRPQGIPYGLAIVAGLFSCELFL